MGVLILRGLERLPGASGKRLQKGERIIGWKEGRLIDGLRAKFCDGETGPWLIAIPGGQVGAAEDSGGGGGWQESLSSPQSCPRPVRPP